MSSLGVNMSLSDEWSSILSLSDYHQFQALLDPWDQQAWICQWIQQHPDQCLAALGMQVSENCVKGPFIFYSLRHVPRESESIVVEPLLRQAIQLGVPLASLRDLDGSNLLCLSITLGGNHRTAPLIPLMVDHGISVEEGMKWNSQSYTPAMLAISQKYDKVFATLLQYYDAEKLDRERPHWERMWSSLKFETQQKFELLIAERQAQLLQREAVAQEVVRANEVSRVRL